MDKNTWAGICAAALCLAFVFLQPGNSPNGAVETLLQNTMAIHDEAMKEMAEMNRISRVLRGELAGAGAPSARADSLRSVLEQMTTAEEDMYDWMRQYTAPTRLPPAEAATYLSAQHRAIRQNQLDIRAARDAGKQLLRTQPQ